MSMLLQSLAKDVSGNQIAVSICDTYVARSDLVVRGMSDSKLDFQRMVTTCRVDGPILATGTQLRCKGKLETDPPKAPLASKQVVQMHLPLGAAS